MLAVDQTKLKDKFGYSKIKQYVLTEYNVMEISKSIFGDKLFYLYNAEMKTSNNILRVVEVEDKTLIYQTSNILYSTFLGYVSDIKKYDNYYSVDINLVNGSVTIYGLVSCLVNQYQKIDVDTIIGELANFEGEYYYYYQKN